MKWEKGRRVRREARRAVRGEVHGECAGLFTAGCSAALCYPKGRRLVLVGRASRRGVEDVAPYDD